MRKIIGVLFFVLATLSVSGAGKVHSLTARPAPAWLTSGAIYQIQARAFTPEGTLKAAERKLPHLAGMGVTCVYLCPVFDANKHPDKKMWSPRQRASGITNAVSSYCMNDYWHVDPEYGTDKDFKDFIAAAHRLGMRVMIDLVYAHCSPFAVFLKEHPDFVVTKADGTPKISPWSSLTVNFASRGLREYLIANMMYWLAEFKVDAFRCDVADAIPIDFWEEARARVERFAPEIAFLAEGDRNVDEVKAFDLCYGFGLTYSALQPVMDGKAPASFYVKTWKNMMAARPKGNRFMGFFDSHDIANDDYANRREKRWGHDACDMLMVMNYVLGGVPFVYNGQEFCDQARHSIFGRMPMDWSASETPAGKARYALCTRLAALRKAESALQIGTVTWLENDCPDSVLSFVRTAADGRTLISVLNLRGKPVTVTVSLSGDVAKEALLTRGITVTGKTYTCAPFAYDVRKTVPVTPAVY